MIEELPPIVNINASQVEGQRFLDVCKRQYDTVFALSPDGTGFHPTGGNIDRIEGQSEHASSGGAAMAHGIDLQKAGPVLIPLVGFDGDAFLEKRTRFGGDPPFADPVSSSFMSQETINGRMGHP